MPLVNFRQNFASFPSIFTRILKFEHFRGDWAYAEPNFFDIPTFFFQNVHLGPIRWFQNSFSKFAFFIVEICIFIWDFWVIFKIYCMHMLSIRGNDFIAHWAYKETISSYTAYGEMILSHPEHTRKWSKCWLSIRGKKFNRSLSIRRNV